MARFNFAAVGYKDDYKTYTASLGSLYGGLCVSEMPYKLASSQSPDCLNMWFAGNVLGKRKGLQTVKPLGTEPVNSTFERLFHGAVVYQAGNKIKAWTPGAAAASELFTLTAPFTSYTEPSQTYKTRTTPTGGYSAYAFSAADGSYALSDAVTTSPYYVSSGIHKMTRVSYTYDTALLQYTVTETVYYALPARCRFLQYGDKLYAVNGINFVCISYEDGAFHCAAPTPYIPTVIMNADPSSGGGTPLENYNRLGAGFKVTYSSTASVTVFQLPEIGLDATTPTVTFNGASVTDFTYDASAGTVTLTTAVTPGTGGVVITAYKTVTEDVASITGCTAICSFGGANEVKVVLGGNPDYPNYYFASGTGDPTYWPYNLYNLAGNPDDRVTAFGGLYDTLIVLKERSVYAASYRLGDDGVVRIPCVPVNSATGCDCPDTVQICNNTLVWCNTTGGVYGLYSTSIAEEKNVLQLSGNINGTVYHKGLLKEDNLKRAVSADIDGRYWLCVNDKAYLWDYSLVPYSGKQANLSWWLFDNIKTAGFVHAGEILFARSDREQIDGFTDKFYDYDDPINAYWYSVPLDGGGTYIEKVFTNLYIECRGQTNTTAKIKYITDYKTHYDATDLKTRNFTLLPFSLATFSLSVTKYSKVHHRRPNARWTRHLQIAFENNQPNEDLSITGIVMEYKKLRSVR